MNSKIMAVALSAGLMGSAVAGDFNLNQLNLQQVLGTLNTQPVSATKPAASTPKAVRVMGNTGSVMWDKAEYTVPGIPSRTTGDVIAHIRVNDPDWSRADGSAGRIASGKVGPVTVKIIHNGQARAIYTAGGEAPRDSELGPMQEIAPGAGIFQANVYLRGDMGIQAGDTLRVEYMDPADASGFPNLASQNAAFAMHDAVLQTDMSVYIRGRQMIVTLVDPALNRDSQEAEQVDLRSIRVLADGIDTTLADPAFQAEPGYLTETGQDTGIFQVVLTMPLEIDNVSVKSGEKFRFLFNDVNPASAKAPYDKTQVVEVDVYTSNFGATVVLDQVSYGTGDMAYVTVVAPDFNFDPNSIDTVGDGKHSNGIVTISAGGEKLGSYTLAETGVDTGIFTGKFQLSPTQATGGAGPNLGVLKVVSGEILTVTFEPGDGTAVSGTANIH